MIWWVPLAPLRGGELVASAVASVLSVEEEAGPCARRVDRELARAEAGASAARQLRAPRRSRRVSSSRLSSERARTSSSSPRAESRWPSAASRSSRRAARGRGCRRALPCASACRRRTSRRRRDPWCRHCAVLAARQPPACGRACRGSCCGTPACRAARATRHPSRRPDVDRATQRSVSARCARRLRGATTSSRIASSSCSAALACSSAAHRSPAIEGVCDADLEDRPLACLEEPRASARQATDDEPRYWMLETIREFAAEELAASGELDLLRARHLGWFVERCAPLRDAPESGRSLSDDSSSISRTSARPSSCAEERRGSRARRCRRWLSPWRRRHFRAGDTPRRRTLRAAALALRARAARRRHVPRSCSASLLRVLRTASRGARVEYRTAETHPRRHDGAATAQWWDRWIDLKTQPGGLLLLRERSVRASSGSCEELEPAVAAPRDAQSTRCDLLHVRAAASVPRRSGTRSPRRRRSWRASPSIALEPDDRHRRLHPRVLPSVAREARRGGDGASSAGCRRLARGRRCARRDPLASSTASSRGGWRDDVDGARARLAELEALDELHGYFGLLSANAAWLAFGTATLDRVRPVAARTRSQPGASEGRTE